VRRAGLDVVSCGRAGEGKKCVNTNKHTQDKAMPRRSPRARLRKRGSGSPRKKKSPTKKRSPRRSNSGRRVMVTCGYKQSRSPRRYRAAAEEQLNLIRDIVCQNGATRSALANVPVTTSAPATVPVVAPHSARATVLDNEYTELKEELRRHESSIEAQLSGRGMFGVSSEKPNMDKDVLKRRIHAWNARHPRMKITSPPSYLNIT
jgi:hypothetical protein